MDSMMIESNIRFLSRMELIYTCISKLAIYFDKNYPNKIPDDLKHYTDSNDYNRIFYHQLNDNMEQIIQALLSDSDKLLELCGTDYESQVSSLKKLAFYMTESQVLSRKSPHST